MATSVVQCQIGRVNWRSPVPSSELDPSCYQGLIRFVLHEAVFKHAKRRQDFLWKFTLPSSEREKVLKLLDSQNLNAFSLFNSEESLMETLSFRSLEFRTDAPSVR